MDEPELEQNNSRLRALLRQNTDTRTRMKQAAPLFHTVPEQSLFRLAVKHGGMHKVCSPALQKGGALIFIKPHHAHARVYTLSISVCLSVTHTHTHTRVVSPHSTSEQLIITISCKLTLPQQSEPRLAKQHSSRSEPERAHSRPELNVSLTFPT